MAAKYIETPYISIHMAAMNIETPYIHVCWDTLYIYIYENRF